MDFSLPVILLISFLFFGVAFLYSSVGHGGASGYLAVLSFFAVAPATMSTTALSLNLLVAGTALVSFYHARHVDLRFTWPFVAASVPAAFLGGLIRVAPSVYYLTLATVLLLASIRFLFEMRAETEQQIFKSPSLTIAFPVGVGIGFVSGLVGVGGGIFLSPLILLAGWADAKKTAATSAVFIFVNSLAGLLGRVTSDTIEVGALAPFLLVTFLGGLLGSQLGARRFHNRTIKRALGAVLLIASIKLILSTV